MNLHSVLLNRKMFLAFFGWFLFNQPIEAQELKPEKNTSRFTISGYVKESSTGETMPGASVFLRGTSKGTSSNPYGFFSITVEQGAYTVVCNFLGYAEQTKEIVLDKNIKIEFQIQPKAVETQAVTIEGERKDQNVQAPTMGLIELPAEQIKKLPSFLGEVDVLKTIQLLPGIKSAGEGTTGFYVRGGGPDQNLVMLDEAVVYNASHLFGFFSVFNSDAVKNVSLIKGGMPSQFGGRLSSVVDVTMKEGNNKQYQVEGGIGLISSRLTVQGPIKKETGSFIVSGRRTYIDALVKPFIPKTSRAYGSGYYFYDLNAKFNYKLSEKDRLFLSGYYGKDVFSYKNSESDYGADIPWGNAVASLRWNHLFSDQLFVNTSLIYSDYDFGLRISQDKFEFGLFSGITDYNGKVDFTYFPHVKHTIRFGLNYIYHQFAPSHATAKAGETEFDLGKKSFLYGHDGAIYLQDEYEINRVFSVNAGIRYSGFIFTGPFTRYIKDQNRKTVDSVYYGPGKYIQTYHGPEPRITLKIAPGKKSSFKLAYTENYQYIHLATLASVTLPTDIWMPSTDLVNPQFARQAGMGYFRNFKDNTIEFSVETYYKIMENMIEYEDGFAPGDNLKENPDNNFVFGKGESYGLEFFLNKKAGKLTGWIGYTLSWTNRTFPELNNGKTFFARYDRRHDLSVVASYDLNSRYTFSAIFVYATGNAITLPVNRYFMEGNLVAEYGERNGYRMPAYHRGDVSMTFKPDPEKRFYKKRDRNIRRLTRKGMDFNQASSRTFKKPRVEWNLSISIYNVYNRANPFFIYFDDVGDVTKGTLNIQARQVSLFPILPGITYNFKF